MHSDPGPANVAGFAQFLRRGVGVVAASRDAALNPSVAKALACDAGAHEGALRVFLVRGHAGQLLRDVAAQGVISVTCSHPSSHATLQFKGEDAREVALAPRDRERVAHAVRAYVDDLVSLGFSAAFGNAMCAHDAADLVAIEFTVSAAFDQTPGPRAGESLGVAGSAGRRR